jgi:glutamyl-tRNA synthetase
VDSFVILNADGTPTDTFASACDDMISGITLIIRSEKYLSNSPRQEYIKTLLGYEQETRYAHLPVMLNSNGEKMDMHNDTSSVKWLFEQGYIPDAITNYLIGIGNNTPTEIFTLPEALEWFDLSKISKSPVIFDIEELRFINSEHLRLLDDKRLSTLFGFADENIGKLAKLYLEEASTINELETKIKPIFEPKDFNGTWGEEMRAIAENILEMPMIDDFDDFSVHLVHMTGLKGENFFKPLRLVLTGAEDGPELSEIYPLIKPYLLEIAS